MPKLKKFTATLERRTVTIETVQVTVEAENMNDACILARYKEISHPLWNSQPSKEEPVALIDIHEVPEVLLVDEYVAPAQVALHVEDDAPL